MYHADKDPKDSCDNADNGAFQVSEAVVRVNKVITEKYPVLKRKSQGATRGRVDDAEDLCQQTVERLIALVYAGKVKEPTELHLRRLLWKIWRGKKVDLIRRISRENERKSFSRLLTTGQPDSEEREHEQADLDEQVNPARMAEHDEEIAQAKLLLLLFNERERKVLLLTKEGLDPEQVAKAMGMTVGAVYTLKMRIRQKAEKHGLRPPPRRGSTKQRTHRLSCFAGFGRAVARSRVGNPDPASP